MNVIELACWFSNALHKRTNENRYPGGKWKKEEKKIENCMLIDRIENGP